MTDWADYVRKFEKIVERPVTRKMRDYKLLGNKDGSFEAVMESGAAHHFKDLAEVMLWSAERDRQ